MRTSLPRSARTLHHATPCRFPPRRPTECSMPSAHAHAYSRQERPGTHLQPSSWPAQQHQATPKSMRNRQTCAAELTCTLAAASRNSLPCMQEPDRSPAPTDSEARSLPAILLRARCPRCEERLR
eukprot:6571749-Prymnesium_polylepis.1